VILRRVLDERRTLEVADGLAIVRELGEVLLVEVELVIQR